MLDRSVPTGSVAAIPSAPGSGIDAIPEPGANPGSGTDDWFFPVAVAVFGDKETGLHLHMATGWPRTSCYAFVARDPAQRRKVNTEFLRVLFHSDHGAPFHAAFMEGNPSRWWSEHQRNARLAAAAERFRREIDF